MKHLKLRMATRDDAPEMLRLLRETRGNDFDSSILSYPTLGAVCASDGDKPVAFLPYHHALMLESVGMRAGASGLESATAFRDLIHGVQLVASQSGVRELYFVTDVSLGANARLAAMAIRHGFESLPWQTLRMRV